MAIRTSGTTQRPPTSGPLQPPAPISNPGSINIVNTSIFITGQSIINGYTEFVLDKNVGSIPNPDGINYIDGTLTVDGDIVATIDGYNLPKGDPNALYSTTGDRKEAGSYFSGGVGIEQDLSVGGFIYGRINNALTATTSSQLLVLATDADDEYFPAFTNRLLPYKGYPGASNLQDVGFNYLYGDPTSVNQITDQTHITYNPALGRLTLNNLHITSTATSNAVNTGSVIVDGGVGIAKDVYIGGGVYPGNTVTSTIGSLTATWATSYLENIYTRFLGNNSGNINIAPNNGIEYPNTGNGGVVDVFGEIRVRGQNPIGTAPVVTNTLYVTVDGNDTNDGRAQDASRACRTINGAINSPYYQPGTQILVSAGFYLEDNPLRLKPYTSVRGSDIRTTFVEPINKTQDLFHVDSGCYLNYMTFINGRSGLLPGQYDNRFNRGAYATAFPPLPPDEQITLFHSPYIQNCTNLSGPWLIDGTMFVPNQTVQVPLAAGTGTWVANTTSIVVNFSNLPVNGFINAGKLNSSSTQYTGTLQGTTTNRGSVPTVDDLLSIADPVLLDGYVVSATNDYWVYTDATGIELGQSIEPGKQNPGFFNARTLMLANKPFIQAQIISYINQEVINAAGTPSSIWYNFEYDQQLCYRDVGILIENVSYDAAFGGNEKSIESGKAYWNGVVSVIGTQIDQTVAAISQLATLLKQVAVNTTCTVLAPVANIPVGKQVINTVLVDGDVVLDSIDNLFDIIITIIEDGPEAAPAKYNGQGPDAAFMSAEILLQANRKFIQESTINYINQNLISGGPTYLPYNKIKCARDAGIVVDSIAADLLHPSQQFSQTTFAGLQYYAQNGYVGNITTEITTTTAAVVYLKDLAIKIIQNRTATDDLLVGINRFSNGVQNTNNQPATANEIAILKSEFDIITSILNGNTEGWTDLVAPNGSPSNLRNVQNAHASLIANINYMSQEVYSYIVAPTGLNYSSNNFTTATCIRDLGYIINSVAFDLLHGGNRQAIQSGLSYYNQVGGASLIPDENTATSQAFTFMGGLINSLIYAPTSYTPYQNKIRPVTGLPLSNNTVTSLITEMFSTLTNIIQQGPTGYSFTPIGLTTSTVSEVVNAYEIIKQNRPFIVAETLSWIDFTFNSTATFQYDQELCYRDVGLMVDAVSQDILLGGNQKSIEAGLAYWNQGYNYIANEVTTTTAAINYISTISLKIIANQTVTPPVGTIADQVINTFFQYGGDYMPQQAVARNYNIISTIIANGPQAAPPLYAGGGLFALTGLNGADVKASPVVTYIGTISDTQYLIGLNTSTVGFGFNSSLYFGNTRVFPLQDNEVNLLSRQQTGSESSWDDRKVDKIGGMGGSLVDGSVISSKSPIQSFVYDAFTQLTQGGRGVRVTNNGYAQLVSVFTIFASVAVQVDNGGIASIVNSNANFGDLCLVAKGYGTRAFSGTVYNPPYRSYPFSPGVDGLDQYYPAGYWPNKGTVEVFVPDPMNRPHISLVMEVVPPKNYKSEFNSPELLANGISLEGFLNAQPSTGTLVTGAINLTDLDTTDVYINNSVYVVDQFGYPYDNFSYLHDDFGKPVDVNGKSTSTYYTNPAYKIWYCATGTYVTDINFNNITLNQPLTSGANFSANQNYFTVYFTGNAYYTVQTSKVADNPYKLNQNILSANNDPYYQGPSTSQINQHIAVLTQMNAVIDDIVNNTNITATSGNTATQFIDNALSGGDGTWPFIDLRFGYITSILGAANINSALSIIPSKEIAKTGVIPSGAGSAIELIKQNIEFIGEEIYAYTVQQYPGLLNGSAGTAQQVKCKRDVELICQQLIYDLETGGNYNMIHSGLSYWSRPGTYHVIEMGEAVTNTSLFPDGATVNFYQRSYISASGYVFEYVGAGANYGALPQVGQADPIQKQETVQLDSGKVFFTSTDQNGDFRIGPSLVISQATGVISGRTFTQSLFANMTPFILAIEA